MFGECSAAKPTHLLTNSCQVLRVQLSQTNRDIKTSTFLKKDRDVSSGPGFSYPCSKKTVEVASVFALCDM